MNQFGDRFIRESLVNTDEKGIAVAIRRDRLRGRVRTGVNKSQRQRRRLNDFPRVLRSMQYRSRSRKGLPRLRIERGAAPLGATVEARKHNRLFAYRKRNELAVTAERLELFHCPRVCFRRAIREHVSGKFCRE